MENKMINNDNSYLENKSLKEKIEKDTPIKEWLVNYVGTEFLSEMKRINSETPEDLLEWDGSVTVEMIIEMMATQFPEFLMAVAEENFIRGYTQAMVDVYETDKPGEE
jgi:hypothetical protein